MKLPYYTVDAFTSDAFRGNPAAVMILDEYLDDDLLQAIAREHNLSETAFLVKHDEAAFELRWFTPAIEVPLCGHATLASAHILFNEHDSDADEITFITRQSGDLFVKRSGHDQLEMDFPVGQNISEIPCPEGLARALGKTPQKVFMADYMLALFESPEDVVSLEPDIPAIAKHANGHFGRGNLICAAAGSLSEAPEADVISRFFAPGSGIDEDPVTGSAHCIIAPIFSDILSEQNLHCYQAFPNRGGHVETELQGDRVLLRGNALTICEGQMRIA